VSVPAHQSAPSSPCLWTRSASPTCVAGNDHSHGLSVGAQALQGAVSPHFVDSGHHPPSSRPSVVPERCLLAHGACVCDGGEVGDEETSKHPCCMTLACASASLANPQWSVPTQSLAARAGRAGVEGRQRASGGIVSSSQTAPGRYCVLRARGLADSGPGPTVKGLGCLGTFDVRVFPCVDFFHSAFQEAARRL